jgi:molybdate transport system regulatory protein
MKGDKDNSRYKSYLLNYKIWLSNITGQGIINEGTFKILKLIKEKGSLKAAVAESGISYRKAWGDLKDAEQHLGYHIIDKQRGGKDGGTTQLTTQGEKLIEAYQALQQKFDDSIEEAFLEFQNKIKGNE